MQAVEYTISHVTTSHLPSASSIVALKGRTNSLEPSTVAETGTINGGCRAMLSGIILSVNCCLAAALFRTPVVKDLMYRLSTVERA